MQITQAQAIDVMTTELTEAHSAIFAAHETEGLRKAAWDRLDAVFRLIDSQPKKIASEVERRFEAARNHR
jgi:hypothetical protein